MDRYSKPCGLGASSGLKVFHQHDLKAKERAKRAKKQNFEDKRVGQL